MSFGFFLDASSLSHSLSNFSERLSAESAEEIWYMSDNSRRCLYPFFKIGVVQLQPRTQVGEQSRPLSRSSHRRSGQQEPPQEQNRPPPPSPILQDPPTRDAGSPQPTSPCVPPPPCFRDPSRIPVTFARCILKEERKSVSPVSKCSLGEPASSAAAPAVFTLALPLSVREE